MVEPLSIHRLWTAPLDSTSAETQVWGSPLWGVSVFGGPGMESGPQRENQRVYGQAALSVQITMAPPLGMAATNGFAGDELAPETVNGWP